MVCANVERSSLKMHRRSFVLSIATALTIIVACIFALNPQRLSIEGGCPDSSSPFMKKYFNDGRQITYCGGGDAFVGNLQSQEFLGNGNISFKYSGYPSQPGLGFYLIASNSERHRIELPDVGEVWRMHQLAIPEKFLGQKLTVFAQDSSIRSFGWVGLSVVKSRRLNDAGDFFARMIVVALTVSLLLSVVLTLFLSRFEAEDSIALVLLAFGLYGYVGFFGYLVSYNVGIILSSGLIFVTFLSIIWIYKAEKFLEYGRSLLFVAPVAILTLFVLVIGYYPFSALSDDSWQVAANRWLSLPIDNWLPKIFADQIWEGNIRRPMIGDWLSSDRPPLQTGVFLLFYPMMPASTVLYQTVATMLQCFIILATWLFLSMNGYVRNRVSLILVVCFSSLVLVHSLFVWPKLISATYLILCFSYLWREKVCKIRGFVIGTSAALAMLSHGGAFFALSGILLVWIFVQVGRGPSRKLFMDCLAWGGIFIIIMLPWSLYGRYVDPESGRLIKWHLAGLVGPSEITVVNALLDAYGNLTFDDWVKGRFDNIIKIVSGNVVLDAFGGGFDQFVAGVRAKSFFGFFYSMWFLSPFVAILVWVLYGCKSLPRNIWLLLSTAIVATLVWVLLMFEPGSTVIHQGSFFAWLAFFIWSALVISDVSRFIYILVLFLNLALAIVVYIFDLRLQIEHELIHLGLLSLLSGAFVLSLQTLERHEVRVVR